MKTREIQTSFGIEYFVGFVTNSTWSLRSALVNNRGSKFYISDYMEGKFFEMASNNFFFKTSM